MTTVPGRGCFYQKPRLLSIKPVWSASSAESTKDGGPLRVQSPRRHDPHPGAQVRQQGLRRSSRRGPDLHDRTAGDDFRSAGSQWGRQDHDDPHDHGHHRPRPRRRSLPGESPQRQGSLQYRLPARRARPLPQDDHHGPPAVSSRAARYESGRGAPRDRHLAGEGGTGRLGQEAGRRALQGHAAEDPTGRVPCCTSRIC